MLCDARTAATGPGSPSTPVKLGCNRTSISLSWQVRARRGARQTPPLPSAHPVLLRRPGSRQHAACAPSMQTPEDDGGSAISEYEAELLPKCAGSRLGGMPNEWLLVYRVRHTRHPAPAGRVACQPEPGLATQRPRTPNRHLSLYGVHVPLQGSGHACTIEALRPGCTYQMRVRAINAAGVSSYCIPAELSTSPGVPEPPRALAITSRTQSGACCWGCAAGAALLALTSGMVLSTMPRSRWCRPGCGVVAP